MEQLKAGFATGIHSTENPLAVILAESKCNAEPKAIVEGKNLTPRVDERLLG